MELAKIIKSAPAFVLPALINLVSLVAFTRLLSLADYGQLSLSLVTVELLQGVLYGWVSMCVMRFYQPADPALSIGVGLHFAAALSAGLGLAGALLAGWAAWAGSPVAPYLGAVLLGTAVRGVGNYVQDSYRMRYPDLRPYTWVTVAANASFYLPAVGWLLWRPAGTVALLLVQGGGLGLFLAGLGLRHRAAAARLLRARWPRPAYTDFLAYGLPLVVSFVSLSMFVRIDRYLIQYNVGAEALGTYSAAFSLSNLTISAFFLMLTLPTYPAILKKFNEGDPAGATAIYRRNGLIILLVGGPLLLFSCLANDWLCQLLFGAAKGAKVAVLFSWVVGSTFLFNYKVHYYDQVYQFYQRTRVAMYLGVAVGLGHLGLAYLLSRSWGARGVSASGMALNLLAIAFTLYYSRYHLPQAGAAPGPLPAVA